MNGGEGLPPLTDEQVARVVALLRPLAVGQGGRRVPATPTVITGHDDSRNRREWGAVA